ncbi:MAG: MFS transporter [Devosia sp.]|nr:MFS transporter [Devosia sp.]
MRYLLVLAIGQNIGWGTVGLLAVLGSTMAADLDLSPPVIFAGTSVFYVTMGLCAPLLGSAFVRFGARMLLAAGSFLSALGFIVLAASQGAIPYFLAWAILGLAGSASLSTASHIALNEALGARARNAIGLLMLASGLSGTIFWPTTAYLAGLTDWRMISLIFAALLLFAAALYALGLPRPQPVAAPPAKTIEVAAAPAQMTFYLVAAAIALNAFVTFGFSAILIELLKSLSVQPDLAAGLASSLGIIQVAARALDLLGGARWDGLSTALVAAPALVLSLILLLVFGATWAGVVSFIVVYGIGAGALAVARATMPLVFYDKAEYARALTRIALPLNLISAAAPPALIALLDGIGPQAVLIAALVCSGLALGVLVLLNQRRPAR